MLADHDIHPTAVPPGFTPVAGEPVFDAKRHLQFDKPERTWSLADFGYDAKTAAQYATQVAVLAPVRILSDEGIAALQSVIELCRAREQKRPGMAGRLHYATYHSRYIRDLHCSPELTGYLSEYFQTPIGPHPMPHMSQINYSHDEVGKDIVGWHHDRIGFTMVLSMYDPTKIKGGRFEWFWGTREEAKDLLAQGDLPRNRVSSPQCQPGTACFMQGSAIMHRGAPLETPGYRASVVFSYVTRDASFPDANRTYFMETWKGAFGVTENQVQPMATEWARHKAWFARARLGTLLEDLPFTEDRAFIVKQLRMAIEPVVTAIERLERDPHPSREDQRVVYDADDKRQMSEPRFMPGKLD